MSVHIALENVSVGYMGRTIVRGINADFLRGKMTCILGPNGSGKTTLLRTLARLLDPLEGRLSLAGQELKQFKAVDLARQMSVMLTQRLELENMTGREVASLGRYPHTGFFGRLSQQDEEIVADCLVSCQATNLAERLFNQMSDGEKQKILIARALAQQPQVLILDEPTMHLDLRHKIQILFLLQRLAVEKGMTVLLTLHEPDLAIKSCGQLVLVKDAQIMAQGLVEEVIKTKAFAELYGVASAGFDPLTCGIEFRASAAKDVFIIGGAATATPLYRACARMGIGFASGVLHQGDLDYFTALNMGVPIVSVPAFSLIGPHDLKAAWALAKQYRFVLDSGFPQGASNSANLQLFTLAQEHGLGLLSTRNEPLTGACRLADIAQLKTILSTVREE